MNRYELREKLRHVRFIGAGSGGGKSTVAHRLAEKYGLQVYDAEQFSNYVPRTTPDNVPSLHAFLSMGMDERWLNRHPQVMFETFHGFHGEQFNLVVEDLLALPKAPEILAEGFTLRPRLLAPLPSEPNPIRRSGSSQPLSSAALRSTAAGPPGIFPRRRATSREH